MKRNRKNLPARTHAADRDSQPAVAPGDGIDWDVVADFARTHTDRGTDRPRIGEKVLADRVQAALRGGGTARERARVAAGIIEQRVVKAYKLDEVAA